jgi:hypothetical protein
MKARAALTGGCSGHFGEDYRCYCDLPDVHVEFYCETPKCKRKNTTLRVGELSDKYSIARWFAQHYQPSADATTWWEKP